MAELTKAQRRVLACLADAGHSLTCAEIAQRIYPHLGARYPAAAGAVGKALTGLEAMRFVNATDFRVSFAILRAGREALSQLPNRNVK